MKNKYTAAIFALFFGWTGAHRFYLGQSGMGVLYAASFLLGWFFPFLFVLRWIPILLGFIDAAAFLFTSEKDFNRKYNSDEEVIPQYRRESRQHKYRKPDFERQSRKNPTHRRKELKDMPLKKNPYKLSGVRKFKDFDIKGALEDFEKGLEMNPDDISLHFNIACAYSLLENVDKGYFHLEKAVELGFNDNEKISSHDALAFLRIQPRWEEFKENGFSFTRKLSAPKEDLLSDDLLLTQLKKLDELRKKGLITEEEFELEKRKLEADS